MIQYRVSDDGDDDDDDDDEIDDEVDDDDDYDHYYILHISLLFHLSILTTMSICRHNLSI